MFLTTEAVVADIPDKNAGGMGMPYMGGSFSRPFCEVVYCINS